MRPNSIDDYKWIYSAALEEGMHLFTEGVNRQVSSVQIKKKRSGTYTQVQCADGKRLYLYPKDRVAILIEKDLPAPIKQKTPKHESKDEAWLCRQLRIND